MRPTDMGHKWLTEYYVCHSGTGLVISMDECELFRMDEYFECEGCGNLVQYDEPCERCELRERALKV